MYLSADPKRIFRNRMQLGALAPGVYAENADGSLYRIPSQGAPVPVSSSGFSWGDFGNAIASAISAYGAKRTNDAQMRLQKLQFQHEANLREIQQRQQGGVVDPYGRTIETQQTGFTISPGFMLAIGLSTVPLIFMLARGNKK